MARYLLILLILGLVLGFNYASNTSSTEQSADKVAHNDVPAASVGDLFSK